MTNRSIRLAILAIAAPAHIAPAAASPRTAEVGAAAARPAGGEPLPALASKVAPDRRAPSRTAVITGGVQTSAQDDGGECLTLGSASAIDVVATGSATPRLALVARMWGRSILGGTHSITYGLTTVGARYKVAPGIQIEAGAGLARATIDGDDDIDVTLGFVAPAAAAVAGIDLAMIADVGIGIEVRGGANLYDPGVPIYALDAVLAARW